MNSEIAISIQQISKMYRLYDRPQDRLKEMLLWRFGKLYSREFWALHDLSLEVKRGESIAIIGRNGSGKSTLLQIVAGTLAATTGSVTIKGRVAALLELGSGFDMEFTGRENVYLNGAILGLKREQVDERLDTILAFADIGDFIDQPVKFYSSGMFVRLAFAVAVNVDADILVIDEALAVGDIFFRQKCYQRLQELQSRGVSILLVSHGMAEIEQFCQRALLLKAGHVVFEGMTIEAIQRYYLLEQEERIPTLTVQPKTRGSARITLGHQMAWPEAPETFLDISNVAQVENGWAVCMGVAICDTLGRPTAVFQQGETAVFYYEFQVMRDIEVPIGGVQLENDKNVIVHGKSTLEYGTPSPSFVPAGALVRFRQEIKLDLDIGEYTFLVGIGTISHDIYEQRQLLSHNDLYQHVIRICHLPVAGQFAVIFRTAREPLQLMHHGVANLPGKCEIALVASDEEESAIASTL